MEKDDYLKLLKEYGSSTELISNSTLLSPIEAERHLAEILRDGKYPRTSLPAFIHEFTHHYCFHSPVGSALACLSLRAFRDITRCNLWGAPCDGQRVAEDLIRYRTVKMLLEPLFEGLALFSEFDTMTLDSEMVSIPTRYATDCFIGHDVQEKKGFENAARQMFINLRIDEDLENKILVERKVDVLTRPLDCRDPYLPGYLAVKSLWRAGVMRSSRFWDKDLFLSFLRAYCFDDYELVRLLLDEDVAGSDAVNRIVDHISHRLINLLKLDFDRLIPIHEHDGLQDDQRSVEEKLQAPVTPPWDDPTTVATGWQKLNLLVDDLKHSDEHEPLSRGLSNLVQLVLSRRILMNIGTLPVHVQPDSGSGLSLLNNHGELIATAAPIDGKVPPAGKGSADLILIPSLKAHILTVTLDDDVIGAQFFGNEIEARWHEPLINAAVSLPSITATVNLIRETCSSAIRTCLDNIDDFDRQTRLCANAIYHPLAFLHTDEGRVAELTEKMWNSGFNNILGRDIQRIYELASLGLWMSLLPKPQFISDMAYYHAMNVESVVENLKTHRQSHGFPFILDDDLWTIV